MDGEQAQDQAPRTLTLTLVNKRGLHARAAAKFVQTVEWFDATVTVRRDDHTVGGRSIMGLLMFGAPCGASIEVTISGPDADGAARAIAELVGSGFGEID